MIRRVGKIIDSRIDSGDERRDCVLSAFEMIREFYVSSLVCVLSVMTSSNAEIADSQRSKVRGSMSFQECQMALVLS